MTEPDPILLVLGPTAGGKTEVAIELATRLPGNPVGGECICADSMQVYRGMDVGTAKPTAAQRRAVPHHGLDLLDPSEDGFSVDAWLRMAEDAIAGIRGRGRFPIVVGGTGLYAQALLEGLFQGPAPSPALRRSLEQTDDLALRERLEAVDPPAAERIHRNDRKRTVRAVEVYELTGRRISDLQSQWGGGGRRDVRIIGLDYSVPAINARINARVRSMIEEGLVEEVSALLEAGLGRQAAAALGYRQIAGHLAGRLSLPEAIEQIKISTRRLAKQQRSWLRRFRAHAGSMFIAADALSPQAIAAVVLEDILPPRTRRESRPAGLTRGVCEGNP